jgi:hypothetical protein
MGEKPMLILKETITASPIMVPQDVLTTIAPKEPTDAHYAKAWNMGPNHASLSDFLTINTPLRAEAWEETLQKCNLYHLFADVPWSISSGFDMGISSDITLTYTPPNHKSSTIRPDIITQHINKELSSGHYTSPFSRT